MPYKDREKYLSTQRGYYNKDKEIYKWRSRFNRLGVTKEDFLRLIEIQNNKCKLCEKSFQGLFGNDCHVDHCHETGKIRGLLCMPCNVGLGMLGDNEKGISKALAYVKGELQ